MSSKKILFKGKKARRERLLHKIGLVSKQSAIRSLDPTAITGTGRSSYRDTKLGIPRNGNEKVEPQVVKNVSFEQVFT
ncbi:MAG: hypothetical protein WCR70_09630, partial [Sphaerochaetaceae bacterium]